MQDHFVKALNTSDVVFQEKLELINKTSNGFEHYNHHFNEICTSIHLNLARFTRMLCGDADKVISRMEDIDKGR